MEHDATQKDWWMSPDATPVSALSRRALLLVPLSIGALFGTGSWLLFDRLQRSDDQSLAPPSPLIGKQLPAFALPGQMPSPGFSSADVIAAARPVLLNFFASWCMPCAQEAPVLRALKQLRKDLQAGGSVSVDAALVRAMESVRRLEIPHLEPYEDEVDQVVH